MSSNINNKFAAAIASFENVKETVKNGNFQYDENDCVIKEFDQLNSDAITALESIVMRSYRLKDRVKKIYKNRKKDETGN